MDRETARHEIRSRIKCTDYLEPSKGGLYVCPFCGSGRGANGTGALKVYDTNTFTCHACKRSGDVIDLYREATGADYNTALSLMAQEIGIDIDRYTPAAADFAPARKNDLTESRRRNEQEPGRDEPPAGAKNAQEAAERPTEAPADYTPYYRECRNRLQDAEAGKAGREYLQRRGISAETAAAYWIGFDPAADPAGAPGAGADTPKAHPCPRIIIPTSTGHYIGRSIDPDTPKSYSKMNPATSKGAAAPAIFNAQALYAPDVQEVFVLEGALDALSVIEAGAAAIALNSAANGKKLIEKLEQRRTDATLILCRDNDPKPETAERVKKQFAALAEDLRRLNISFIEADINGSYKDANEHLTGNKATFADAVERARAAAAARPDNTRYYIEKLMTGDMERFKEEKKTGFANLDQQAGGLYPGLYVLAAISSLGKTSFALQLADQLAAGGHDVIFFSLEQSRLELVSKSLARRTAQEAPEKAVTSLAIRKGYLPKQVLDAAQAYTEAVADRLSIVEGNFSCNITFIGDYIRRYIQRTGKRPVVFIDYLQILQPADDMRRQSTKEAVDTIITDLKRLSRDLDLTLIAISSVNRANYMQPIDFESLKESGGIEFTADVILGMQLQCLNEDLFSQEKKTKEKRERVKQAKAENPRKIELTCLKNRYGIASYSCAFDYFPASDLFTESAVAAADFSTAPAQPRAGRRL